MKKKILALCLVVVLVATAITGVTLAYFTDSTQVVKNTFTVGEVDITLDEAEVERNENDEYVETGDRTEEGNDYDEIFPGALLPKDPTVTVIADSQDCYVRMKVQVEGYNSLATAFPGAEYWGEDGTFLLQNLVNNTWDPTVWVYKSFDAATSTYEFWYKEMVIENEDDDTELAPLFEEILIPANLTNTQIAALENIVINVTADAMQADGFATAELAWAAFGA